MHTALILWLSLACSRVAPVEQPDEDPAFGEELGRIEIPPASSLWADTARTYACAGSDGLYVIDSSAATAPVLLDVVGVDCLAVDGESGRIHVAAGPYGMRVVHPGNLTLIGGYETDFDVDALTVDAGENQAWIAGLTDDGGALAVEGVLTYSVENLTRNKRADLEPGLPLALAYDRTGVFVARDDGTVGVLGLVMDLRATIELPGDLAGSGGGGFLAHDSVLWTALGDAGLVGWDIDDLDAPAELLTWAGDAAWGIAAVSDRLYVGATEELLVLDIGSPASPVEVGRVSLEGIARPEGIYILDGKAWVTDAQDGAFVVVSVDEDAG